jgi:hypothetical protein
VRPHPERLDEWREVTLGDLRNVAFAGRPPITDEAKAEYFDALFHSAAVVGIVTSAFLEAGILGRPVHTIQTPEFRTHQEGMRHFRYLLQVGGGLVVTAGSIEDHLVRLGRVLRGERDDLDRQRRFLTAFVRPHGLDRDATPIFADAVERVATRAREPAPAPALQAWTEPLLRSVAARAGGGIVGRALMEPRAVEELDARNEKVRQLRERDGRIREAKLQRKEAYRRAKIERRDLALKEKRARKAQMRRERVRRYLARRIERLTRLMTGQRASG